MERANDTELVQREPTRVVGYAYSWDVIGDPEFVERVIGLGLVRSAWPRPTTGSLAPPDVSVGAYVTVLPPADLGTAADHTRAVLAAGADELHLYQLGLANRAQLDVLGELVQLGH